MITTTLNSFNKELEKYLTLIIEGEKTIKIKTSKGNVIALSEQEYKGIMETIYLSSQKGLVEKIKEGAKEDISSMSTFDTNCVK